MMPKSLERKESFMASNNVTIEKEMMLREFDVYSAQRYVREGRLEKWVHRYLMTGNWANPGLSEGLKLKKRWWNGPLEVELTALSRAVGPEIGMEYPVAEAYWQNRISKMAQSLTDPRAIPPLIVQYRNGELSVRDGNTRHGAMCLKGWSTCWVFIWYDTESDYCDHTSVLLALYPGISREKNETDQKLLIQSS